jgi:hypothetical protein
MPVRASISIAKNAINAVQPHTGLHLWCNHTLSIDMKIRSGFCGNTLVRGLRVVARNDGVSSVAP